VVATVEAAEHGPRMSRSHGASRYKTNILPLEATSRQNPGYAFFRWCGVSHATDVFSFVLRGESRTDDSPWGEYASCSVTSPSRGRNRATAVYNIGDMALPMKSRCKLGPMAGYFSKTARFSTRRVRTEGLPCRSNVGQLCN
jgi:hypothetical protein